MKCIIGARYNMLADVLRQRQIDTPLNPLNPSVDWGVERDPDSGAIIRDWTTDTNPTTVSVETLTVECTFTAITGTPQAATGAQERWGTNYTNIEAARMTFPANYVLTKRDRVTNIRTKAGVIVWKEEEELGVPTPTVFEVIGVVPIIDNYLNKHTQNMALLERAEVS